MGIKLKKFMPGDKLKQHHADFLTGVLKAEFNDAGKIVLSAKRHFEIDQELTPAGAKSLNKAMESLKQRGVCLPGPCPAGANNCYQRTDPVTGETCHVFSSTD